MAALENSGLMTSHAGAGAWAPGTGDAQASANSTARGGAAGPQPDDAFVAEALVWRMAGGDGKGIVRHGGRPRLPLGESTRAASRAATHAPVAERWSARLWGMTPIRLSKQKARC